MNPSLMESRSGPFLDHVEQNIRANYLQLLYDCDGRGDPKHPQHGHFTGLYQARAKALIEAEKKSLYHRLPQ